LKRLKLKQGKHQEEKERVDMKIELTVSKKTKRIKIRD